MKKFLLLILLLIFSIILVSCQPAEDQISEDLVATQVSIILTETALHVEEEPEPTSTPTLLPSPTEEIEEPTPTPTPTDTPTPTETATSTPDQEDPAERLGAPAWTYDFSGDTSPWDLDSPEALFKTANGYLNMTSRAIANYHNWWVSSPVLRNAYVEATIQMSTCSGADRFGLAVRTSRDGQNFYFMAITCDGRWGFFQMAENVEINTIINYQPAEALTAGLAEPHRVGIWMEGNNFRFYINGVEVGSTRDSTLEDEGFTGFLIAFANTPGFTVRVNRLRYWNLP